jgi:hypothetical protein
MEDKLGSVCNKENVEQMRHSVLITWPDNLIVQIKWIERVSDGQFCAQKGKLVR